MSFKEGHLLIYENCCSVYDEKFLSSLNVVSVKQRSRHQHNNNNKNS